MRGDKGSEPHAVLVNPHQRRIRREIELIALGIDDLRNKGDVGQAG